MDAEAKVDYLLEAAGDEMTKASSAGQHLKPFYEGQALAFYHAAWIVADQPDWPTFGEWARWMRDAINGDDGSKVASDWHRCKKCNLKTPAPHTRCLKCDGELYGIKYIRGAA